MPCLQHLCPSGKAESLLTAKRDSPGRDVPVPIPWYRPDSKHAQGLVPAEGNLLKPAKWASQITFSSEYRAPGRELLIAGSGAVCQQAFRQEVESHSCLLSIMIRKGGEKKMLLYFIKLL